MRGYVFTNISISCQVRVQRAGPSARSPYSVNSYILSIVVPLSTPWNKFGRVFVPTLYDPPARLHTARPSEFSHQILIEPIASALLR